MQLWKSKNPVRIRGVSSIVAGAEPTPDARVRCIRPRPAKMAISRAFLTCVTLFVSFGVSAQPGKAERVVIEYAAPINPEHNTVFELLKQNQALERVQAVLAPVPWPRPLRLAVKGCDGESNAWYEESSITLCYEFVDEMWRRASSSARPPAIAQADAFIGPFLEVSLHEAGHALFDLLKIPVLGREEDAADQVAAYYMLQFPKETKRGLIIGAAYAYANDLNVRSARDLYKRRLEVGRHITFADEHGTPAQRLYNLLCIAYGSDKELFADLVEKGYLPESREQICEGEYRQVDLAYRMLIEPLIERGR